MLADRALAALKSVLRRYRRTVFPALRVAERLLWGGDLRERILLRLLAEYYESLYRRQWRFALAQEQPHFFDHRVSSFGFALGTRSPFGFYRGFFVSELLRDGDRLLDIGCGDGFFARRFFAEKCALVDAIDVEPSAIAAARRRNAARNIRYALVDAVRDPFPSDSYDVVVWDGGIAHFSPESADVVLRKVRDALLPSGVFAGSESLGFEGHDHLQNFTSLDDLCDLLGSYFLHVEVKALSYQFPGGAAERREAFWRCAIDANRLVQAGWRGCSR